MKKLIFALAVIVMSYSASAQNMDKLIDSYISVKNALISGDSKAASQALITFRQNIKEGDTLTQKDDLLKAADNMSKAGNIEKQRAAFNDVSVALWKIVEKSDKINAPVYYQYCPMKKAYWLSKEKEIKNPYYGSAMLTCGKVVETKSNR